MNIRAFYFAFALIPAMAMAQGPGSKPTQEVRPINFATRAVLLANKPEHFTEKEWLKMMQEPVNWSLYPLRITPAMLDTLDARQLDVRFRYQMMGR